MWNGGVGGILHISHQRTIKDLAVGRLGDRQQSDRCDTDIQTHPKPSSEISQEKHLNLPV